jgi:osmotically-inducible protein OsmY
MISIRSDLELRQDVELELTRDPSIDPRRIGVTATGGVVTLLGEVAAYVEKLRAARVVEGVRGVRGIVDQLTVHVGAGASDTELACMALDALRWNAEVPEDDLRLRVENGWITLVGKVEHDLQRSAAERAVQGLRGVRGLTNRIEVAPRLGPDDVKATIAAAFERRAGLDAGGVAIEVAADVVVLRGSVRTWDERRAAQAAALAAPGVREVYDLLTVDPLL